MRFFRINFEEYQFIRERMKRGIIIRKKRGFE